MKSNKLPTPQGSEKVATINFDILELVSMAKKRIPISFDIEYDGNTYQSIIGVDDYENPDEALEQDELELSDVLDKEGSRLGYDAHVLGCSVMGKALKAVLGTPDITFKEGADSSRLIVLIKSNSYNFSVFGTRSIDDYLENLPGIEISEEYDHSDEYIKNALSLEFGKGAKFNVYEKNYLPLDYDLEGKLNYVTAINLSYCSPSAISENIMLCEVS